MITAGGIAGVKVSRDLRDFLNVKGHVTRQRQMGRSGIDHWIAQASQTPQGGAQTRVCTALAVIDPKYPSDVLARQCSSMERQQCDKPLRRCGQRDQLRVMAKLKAPQQADPCPTMSPHQAAPDGSLAIPIASVSTTAAG